MMSELDQLAFRFFKLFAQYEYALKAMKFYKKGRNNQATPDWDRFANEIGKLVLDCQDEQTMSAISYLLEFPPKQQIIKNGELDWDNVSNTEKTAQVLFAHVRRVRNNLYHGGKFNGRWFEAEGDRSHELISNSLTVLESLRFKNDKLNDAISGNSG
jgi:hypothetical protein